MPTISHDSRALLIDGQRTLVLSGALHYPRSTPAMWPELFKRSRAAGLNTVETYVFWNLHEREQGVYDFSGRLDLRRWCALAHAEGLNVILRIGPYICAETNFGGLPPWLREVPGMRIRTRNAPFQDAMERWVRLLCEHLRGSFAPEGGPIILAQIENEYNNIAKHYGAEGQAYLQWCDDLTRELNLGIPWVMCEGAAGDALSTINGFRGHEHIARHVAEHPDQPAIWTEFWPGWYDTWTIPHHRRDATEIAYAAARFIAGGGTGINYYMWHGGTNFGRESMYLQTTSYDFDAPLDEYGLPTRKSGHLSDLHALLHAHADTFLSAPPPAPLTLGAPTSLAFCFGETPGRGPVFLCNDADAEASLVWQGTPHTMPARSVRLLVGGDVVFDSAVVRHAVDVRRRFETVATPLDFEGLQEVQPELRPESAITSPTPLEQLGLTHDRTDYCWYSTHVTITDPDGEDGELTLSHAADVVHVYVDGELRATTLTPLIEQRGAVDGEGYAQRFTLSLNAGTHEISLLCCSLGLIKGDWMLGGRNMVEERKGLWGSVNWSGRPLGPWRMVPGLEGELRGLPSPAGDLCVWSEVAEFPPRHPLVWWRAHFPRPTEGGPYALDLGAMTKGLVWLNGRCLGRYWLAAGYGTPEPWQVPALVVCDPDGEITQRYYHVPADWLKDENTLVLFEELGGDPRGVTLTRRVGV